MNLRQELLKEFGKTLEGEVRFDAVSKNVYSVDASIYEVAPLAVVLPKTKEDILKTLAFANEQGVSLIPRGAATGITGGCLGSGIILDVSKYLTQLLDINEEKQFIVCEPGVIQDHINTQLANSGYRLGPETSTGNRATIGGMLANNSAGAKSLKYGKMVDHVLGVEMILASGETLRFEEVDETSFKKKCLQNDREGMIYRAIDTIQNHYADEIKTRFPAIPRRASGYNLDELVKPQPLNVSKLITGSEGTLGIITEIIIKISPQPKATGLCLIHFHDIIEAMKSIDAILPYEPISLEMIDDKLIQMAKQSPTLRNRLNWLVNDPKAVFAAELEADTVEAVEEKLNRFSNAMKQQGIGYTRVCLSDGLAMANFWKVRSAGLGLLLSKRSYSRSIAFIEDISLPPNHLAPFMDKFLPYLKKIGKEAGIYGHAGSGCLHIRPYIDLRKHEELQLMEAMMNDVSTLLLEYNGALSGEHGDGLTRSWLYKKMFGEKICQAFVILKEAFDPNNLMNPGKIVHPEPFLQNLRLSPDTPVKEIDTFLDFSKEGGFSLAADLCNGNALCRKRNQTMCPSFQASGDEYDTTRARAQTLRSIIHGKLPLKDIPGKGLHDVLDLCIGCKGCKKECPSLVDMAKMKAEALFHYQEKHGYALRDRLVGYLGKINRIASPFAPFFNTLAKHFLGKSLMNRIGITTKRELPSMAAQRFSRWFRHHRSPVVDQHHKAVVLFNDTFTEFHTPEIGIAATHILEALGYRVIVPQWQCCGRTLISKGILRPAKTYAKTLINMLAPFAHKNIPIVGLEPSCLLTITDDFEGLLGYHHQELHTVIEHCQTFDAFAASHIDNQRLPLPFTTERRQIFHHGHCYEKALLENPYTLEVLNTLPNAKVSEIASGCCGMAGSFGYEKEHDDFSIKIGELVLFPAIRQSPDDALIVANGFSCRHQILQGTKRRAFHLAEILHENILKKTQDLD
ncbi:MAG: FAD-linked oxidase C-terminal domain-containing protein [Waddliaceae bacterium]